MPPKIPSPKSRLRAILVPCQTPTTAACCGMTGRCSSPPWASPGSGSARQGRWWWGWGGWGAGRPTLHRAGVGFLRLVDADKVDLSNLHRQAMYDQADAPARARPKVQAAAQSAGRN